MMKPMRPYAIRVALCAAALAALVPAAAVRAGSAEGSLPQAAPDLDLSRFAGRWYVIAHTKASREARDFGAYFEYRERPDGRIDAFYSARDASGAPPRTTERVAQPDPAAPSHWEVRTGWLSSTQRLLLYVSPDYRYAIVGDADRSRGWILARDPEISEWSYAGLLARLAMQGYDVSRLHRVVQRPEQLGMPGFE